MENIRIIEVKQSVFASNDKRAAELRNELKEKKTFLLNVMSSPGSGKTTTLTGLINILKEEFKGSLPTIEEIEQGLSEKE